MIGWVGLVGWKVRVLVWDDDDGKGELVVSEYMEGLVKDMVMLYKNLMRYLFEGMVRYIMMLVFRNYKEMFGGVYREVEVGVGGRERYVFC